MTATRTIPCYAKLNLMLSVGAPETAEGPNKGWHRIAGWFHGIDLSDTLTLEVLPEGTASRFSVAFDPHAALVQSRKVDWPIDKDLIFKAHAALEKHTGRKLPVSATLTKRIPTGGGLGGGSSDAAGMLRGLNDLFDLKITEATLHTLAASVGSDVPFFVDAGTPIGAAPRSALVTNFGETVERAVDIQPEPEFDDEGEPLPAKPHTPPDSIAARVLLVVPSFGCPTPAVYGAFDAALANERKHEALQRAVGNKSGKERSYEPKTAMVKDRISKVHAAAAVSRLDTKYFFNDLTKAAFAVEPRLGALATTLARLTRGDVIVTGSGSTLYIVLPQTRTGAGAKKGNDAPAAIEERVRTFIADLAAHPEAHEDARLHHLSASVATCDLVG